MALVPLVLAEILEKGMASAPGRHGRQEAEDPYAAMDRASRQARELIARLVAATILISVVISVVSGAVYGGDLAAMATVHPMPA